MSQFPKVLLPQFPPDAKNYVTALESISCPYLITQEPINAHSFDVLMLPGGGDIFPYLYSDSNLGSRNQNPHLDLVQLEFLDYFVQSKKPVFGICKGMQLLQVYFGGDLIQHHLGNLVHQIAQGDCYHTVENIIDTPTYRLFGADCIVNSNHHQAMSSPAPSLHIMQRSCDNVIEGLYHDVLPIWGVQWHPERLLPSHSPSNLINGWDLFRDFLHVFL